jgi:hypothetical protein
MRGTGEGGEHLDVPCLCSPRLSPRFVGGEEHLLDTLCGDFFAGSGCTVQQILKNPHKV